MKGTRRTTKLLSLFVLAFMVCSISLLSVACNIERPDDEQPDAPPTNVLEMDVSDILLGVGESYQLTYETNMTGNPVWRSTNDSIATVSSTGLVTAVALGNAEIAVIIGDEVSTCAVSVVEKSSYEIDINTTAITLDVNEKFILTATLKYMGETLNATPTFTVLDSNIITIIDGKVTGIAYGETTLTVKFEYKGETFEKNVSVNVTKSGSVVFDKTSYDIVAVDENGSATVVALNPVVVVGSQTVENPEIEWMTSDESVISINNGVVAVKKAGQAFVTAIYEDSTGCTFEGSVKFDIKLAQRDLSIINLDLTSKQAVIEQLENIDIDTMKINGVAVEFVQDGATFNFPSFNVSGEFDVSLMNDCYEFTGKISAISLISSTSEFTAMLEAAKTASTQEGGFTGYYKLTKDLDFTGVSLASNFMQSNNQNSAKGWQATFDGNGYALKNISMSWQVNNGIFGEIGANGVIKNVSIINPNYNNSGTYKGYGGVLALNNYGRIENVYLELAFGGNGSGATAPNAGIVANGRTGVITGCLVVDKSASTFENTSVFVGMMQSNMDLSTNAYISTAHTSVANANGKTLTEAVKVSELQDLFKAENEDLKENLTMLSLVDEDIMWGNVMIFEKVQETLISSEEQFISMLASAKTASSQEGGFTGYYKLTKDLDFAGMSIASNFMQTNYLGPVKGWQATFDGNGYALKNIGMSWQNQNGIFGEIGSNGVIKDVAIIITTAFKGYGGIVANFNYGTIENVYVELAFEGANNAGIVGYQKGGSITGCLVVDKSTTAYSNTGAIVSRLDVNADLSSNAYVSATHNTVGNVNGKTLTNAIKVEMVQDLFKTENATIKAKLSALSLDGTDVKWGKYKIVEKVEETLISSEEQFISMLASAKTASSQEGGFTGYYKLTKDLDFTGISLASNFMQSNNQNSAKGWQATFDGNGYALKNVGMSWQNNNGIFGEIGTNGVIKNLSIINPQYSTTGTFKGYGAIVALNNYGRIENVYVELAFGGNGYAANVPNAGIVANGRSGIVTGCLVVDKSASTYTNTGAILGVLQNNTNLSTNAYVSAKNGSVANLNGKTLTDAVKVDALSSLFATENATIKAKLTMLTLDGTNIKWGNVIIGTYTA